MVAPVEAAHLLEHARSAGAGHPEHCPTVGPVQRGAELVLFESVETGDCRGHLRSGAHDDPLTGTGAQHECPTGCHPRGSERRAEQIGRGSFGAGAYEPLGDGALIGQRQITGSRSRIAAHHRALEGRALGRCSLSHGDAPPPGRSGRDGRSPSRRCARPTPAAPSASCRRRPGRPRPGRDRSTGSASASSARR